MTSLPSFHHKPHWSLTLPVQQKSLGLNELSCHFLLSLTECKPLSKRLRQHNNDIYGFSTVPAGLFHVNRSLSLKKRDKWRPGTPGKGATGTRDKQAKKRDVLTKTGCLATLHPVFQCNRTCTFLHFVYLMVEAIFSQRITRVFCCLWLMYAYVGWKRPSARPLLTCQHWWIDRYWPAVARLQQLYLVWQWVQERSTWSWKQSISKQLYIFSSSYNHNERERQGKTLSTAVFNTEKYSYC